MTEFWWSADGDEMLILPREVVIEYDLERQALACKTWGELKKLDFKIYVEYLYKADLVEGGDEKIDLLREKLETGRASIDELRVLVLAVQSQLPADEQRFERQSVGAFLDGDWPLLAQQLMADEVPFEIAEEFGDSSTSVFNGDFLHIPADQQDNVLAAMRKLGHTCTENATIWSLTETW